MAAADSTVEVRRVVVDGASLHVTVSRGRHRTPGPALVALHGGPGIDGSGLRLTLAPLADAADVVVPDQRGHGASDLSTPDRWNLDDWADDLAAVIDDLGLRRPVVLGVSFGGWVAIRHAARHPGQPAGLIVAAMTARLPTVEQVAARMGSLAGPAAREAWLRDHSQPDAESAAAVREHCLPLMARRAPSAALAAVRAAQSYNPAVNEHFTPKFQELDLTPDLGTVACPALVVTGALDPLLTPELAAATASACPAGTGRLVTIPGAAHDLFADAPDLVLDEVRRFVLEVAAGT
ncbi:alpha/beta fold hydrolase [Longispora albida]|uniref:alpha/beta fold hydrolase n=1 Tax=Longispora albida TaxID=203523 RepID=UPI0003708DE9|nr:alpha/beta hydrolase [Longispora albida]